VWRGLRTTHPRPAWLPWLFPLGMMAVVLTTGNHYVLDIAGSVTLLLAAIAAASAWGRLAGRRRTRSSTPPAVHRRPDESSLPQG
jgi:succinate-acetate transporter protein